MTDPSNLHEDDDDLREFHAVYCDEAEEHLAGAESLLADIPVAEPEAGKLNAVFRAAHSIHGRAAVFGFTGMAVPTHEMETVFDRGLRRDAASGPMLRHASLAPHGRRRIAFRSGLLT